LELIIDGKAKLSKKMVKMRFWIFYAVLASMSGAFIANLPRNMGKEATSEGLPFVTNSHLQAQNTFGYGESDSDLAVTS